jgi:hypothetical protein
MTGELAHRQMVALTPQDVPGAQADIAEWCREKILELSRELREARQNLRQAKLHKWKHLPWQRVVGRTAARMVYFTKIRAAVRAGYLIVPNFDVEVMAVRVNREKPPERTATYRYDSVINSATPQFLPPGVGRYVDETQFVSDESYTAVDPSKPGETKKHPLFRATGYDTPDFPVLAVKPIVMEATGRAMALKLFDQIGVVTGRAKDPVVVGEIFDPADRYRNKRVSFFIAWWFDTRAL